jgi:hypothetical protein
MHDMHTNYVRHQFYCTTTNIIIFNQLLTEETELLLLHLLFLVFVVVEPR